MYIDAESGIGLVDTGITVEDDLLKELNLIERIIKEIIISKGFDYYSVVESNGICSLKVSPIGKKLCQLLTRGQGEFSFSFPLYDLNPYVALLFRCIDRIDNPWMLAQVKHVHPLEVKLTAALLNGLVDDIRREASSKLFNETLRRFSNAAKKRGKSLNDYIDALYRKYSRLLVIRLELSYEMGYFRKSRDLKECLEEVKADWIRLQTDLHLGKPVEGMVGFACKLEYAHLTGFHYHLLLFFDGSSHRQDITLSRLIGEHWHLEITAGKGRYHNCNARTYRTLGIGQICWNETEKLNTLKGVVADYLVKVDYLLRMSPGCGRTFFRGNMPKSRWSRRGRPRTGSVINQRNDI